jgi:hypothetical protein
MGHVLFHGIKLEMVHTMSTEQIVDIQLTQRLILHLKIVIRIKIMMTDITKYSMFRMEKNMKCQHLLHTK